MDTIITMTIALGILLTLGDGTVHDDDDMTCAEAGEDLMGR